MATYIVGAIVFACIGLAALSLYKSRKRGDRCGGCCGCGKSGPSGDCR